MGVAGILPFRKNVVGNSMNFLITSYPTTGNVCFLLNCSLSEKFLSVLVNGNSTRGLKAKVLIDTGYASSIVKLKTLDNNIYLTRTLSGSFRIYSQNYSSDILQFTATNLDLSEAETVEYIE